MEAMSASTCMTVRLCHKFRYMRLNLLVVHIVYSDVYKASTGICSDVDS